MPLSKQDTDYIRRAYEEGVKRGKAYVAPYLEDKLEGAIGYSVAHVEKYSADQTAWATAQLRKDRSVLAAPTALDFQRYFPRGGEDGEGVAVGNIFVNTGLVNLVSLWIGLSATLINKLSGTGSICGVGTGTAAAVNTDTTLISNGGSAYYQAFDNLASFGTTSTQGQLVGTSTFGSAVANFNWNEWCWASGAGAITAGSNLNSGAGSPFATAASMAMVNHKTNVNLGGKASGSSWVFSTTFTIS